jgi:hypothetical protein
MQQMILNEKLFRHFCDVDRAVVQMNIESRSIPTPPLSEDRLEILRAVVVPKYNEEGLCVETVLLSHQTDNVESIDSPHIGCPTEL